MSDTPNPVDDDRRFELAIRLMSKEVFAFTLFSNSPSAKWLWMSLGAMIVLGALFVFYGTDITALYRNLLSSPEPAPVSSTYPSFPSRMPRIDRA